MSYKGRSLTSGSYLKLDDLQSFFNGTQKTFNLTSGGQAFYPGSAFSILVVLGGVIQEPESAYTLDQSQITFASAPGASDDFFCIVLGVAFDVGVPADGTVKTSTIKDGSVTFDKIALSARGIGIQSGGNTIGTAVTALNFIGIGNTFAFNPSTNTIDISIQGSGVGAGGTWSSNNVGVHTSKIVGVNTTTIVGSANSEGALQAVGNIAITDGALIIDQNVNADIFVPDGKNGLLIGPITVGVGVTIDVAPGSVLVVV
jgi:hypothetical protein